MEANRNEFQLALHGTARCHLPTPRDLGGPHLPVVLQSGEALVAQKLQKMQLQPMDFHLTIDSIDTHTDR